MKQNPFKNVGEIHKEWTAAGVSASRTTTHRRMQDMGFSCRIPCVKPLFKVQGSRFFIICHIHNHTGYNLKCECANGLYRVCTHSSSVDDGE